MGLFLRFYVSKGARFLVRVPPGTALWEDARTHLANVTPSLCVLSLLAKPVSQCPLLPAPFTSMRFPGLLPENSFIYASQVTLRS